MEKTMSNTKKNAICVRRDRCRAMSGWLLVPAMMILCTVMASCSRSLTDLGYRGGPVETYDPTLVGSTQPLGRIDMTYSLSLSPWYYLAGVTRDYAGAGHTTIIANTIPNDSLTRTQRKNMYFLQKFYVDLFNNFRINKFGKKYTKFCSQGVMDSIAAHRQDTVVGKVYGGWQEFIPNTHQQPYTCYINYIGEDWYIIVPDYIYDCRVLIRVANEDKNPRIVAVKKSN